MRKIIWYLLISILEVNAVVAFIYSFIKSGGRLGLKDYLKARDASLTFFKKLCDTK